MKQILPKNETQATKNIDQLQDERKNQKPTPNPL